MIPSTFQEANTTFKAPSDLDESQCKTIPAFAGVVTGGSLDGVNVVITAWKPTKEELDELTAGASVYLCVLGGLPPHYIGTSFQDVKNIA